MTMQNILDRKGSKVFTIHPSATVKNAIDEMRERGVAALVVKTGDAILGIVSERNVVSAVSRFGEQALSMTVTDILTLIIATVAPGDSIKRAMKSHDAPLRAATSGDRGRKPRWHRQRRRHRQAEAGRPRNKVERPSGRLHRSALTGTRPFASAPLHEAGAPGPVRSLNCPLTRPCRLLGALPNALRTYRDATPSCSATGCFARLSRAGL